jgi:hypothetical protein
MQPNKVMPSKGDGFEAAWPPKIVVAAKKWLNS